MVGVLVIVIAIGAWGFATATRPSPRREAAAAAMRMRAMLGASLADSELDGGEVVVRAVADTAQGGGRFLALAGPPGVVPADDPAADWVALDGGVRWRRGTATVDPLGAETDGRIPGTVRCTADFCETGVAGYVVYFVGHSRSARVSWALVLTRERDVILFSWNPASGAWEASER